MKLDAVTCYICQGDQSETWASESGFRMMKCKNCGLVYLNPRPTLEEIDEAARTGLHRFAAGTLNKIGSYSTKKVHDYTAKLKELISSEDLGPKPIRWLDIGAGFGELVQAVKGLAAPGSEVRGIEPCEPKVKKAQSKGAPVDGTPLSKVHETFTHVSLINVYSHLPNPIKFLADVKGLLEQGGHLMLVTGNGGDVSRQEYPGSLYLPDHLSFVGEESLRTVLDRAGFNIVTLNRTRPQPSFDNPYVCFVKNIARWATGRPTVPLGVPRDSRFLSLWVYARARG